MKLAEQQQQDHDHKFGAPPQAGHVGAAESPISVEHEATASPAAQPPAPGPVPSQTAEAPLSTSKSRRKSAAQLQTPTVKPVVPLPPVTQAAAVESTSPSTPGAVKTVPWAVDDSKPKAPAAPMGLREIQEAEAKRSEAQKAAEKAARAAASSPAPPVAEEPTSFSWGLPTSKAGTARATAKDSVGTVPSPGAGATPAPVWTNAAKAAAAKKTMKEIQEEEEKRKKAVKEKETAAATARRAYAETTTKVAFIALHLACD
jgi:PERQ amino acid-rich with GYF domain-containing protein